MRITVDRAELASAFGWASRGLPARPVIPVLDGMRLSVEDSVLTLSVFDYEQSVRARVSGNDAQCGEILVDGRDLKKIVSALPKGKPVAVSLSSTAEALTIGSRGATWTLQALPGEKYPVLPGLPPLSGIADGEAFARSAIRVSRAVSHDAKFPALGCVMLTTHITALDMAATDRYRLAVDKVPWTAADPEAGSLAVLVPSSAMETFTAKGRSGKVSIHLSQDMAGFADDARVLTVRTRSGDFPKYRHLFHAESPLILTTSAPKLAAIIGRVGTMSGRGEPIALDYAGGTLTVQAIRNGCPGAASEQLSGTTDAKEFQVSFNPAYLAQMLEGFDGEVRIKLDGDLTDGPKVAIIRPCGTDSFKALVVQVPARA